MLGLDGRVFRAAWTVLAAALLAALVYLVRQAILVLVLAVLFAYVVWPLVQLAETLCRRAFPSLRASRLVALGLVYAVLLTAAIIAGLVIAPEIAAQAATLYDRVKAFFEGVQKGQVLEQMSARRGWSLATLHALRDQVVTHAGALLPYAQKAGLQALYYLSNVWLVVLVPALAFFLLKDAERLVAGAEALFGDPRHRLLLREIFTDLHDLLAQYMRALIVLSFLTFVSHAVFFLVVGAPYALLLATLAGVLEFIPLVGPLSAGGIVLLACSVAGYAHVLWLLIFLVVWRIIQDYVNMPWVLGSGVALHPLLVIFGILAGAELAGVAGMFLSIPTMAAVRILVRRAGMRRE
jgi:predicted PurR-regulated permease PerM